MNLFFITNSVEMAVFALDSGVDRIFVDLEIIGKQQRQGHLDTLISSHAISDVAALRPHVAPGKLMVRINPLHEGSFDEIEQTLAAGADTLMLPMFRDPGTVAAIARCVAGRARLCLLVETVGAMQSLADCVAVPGVHEVHIGLNDLHLELGDRFMFEPLANGLVDRMAQILNEAAIPFGIGGVARVGEGQLPAELILAEHARLGSTGAILSRTFHRRAASVQEVQAHMDFAGEIGKLRQAYEGHLNARPGQLDSLHQSVRQIVYQIAALRAADALAISG
jgi:citrate lyase beta subunit